jgi:hypothetical protein
VPQRQKVQAVLRRGRLHFDSTAAWNLRYFRVVQATMARVFLSHSSRDKPFVRELYRRLSPDGLICFFDEKSIEWGENFVVSLERGIDECEFFVAVLSPEFVQSKWVELERTSAMADDPAGLTRKMRSLLLQPCEVPRLINRTWRWC